MWERRLLHEVRRNEVEMGSGGWFEGKKGGRCIGSRVFLYIWVVCLTDMWGYRVSMEDLWGQFAPHPPPR